MTVLAVNNWKDNSELMLELVELGYLRKRWATLDPTYGEGTWWKLWRPRGLVTHDIELDGIDFRKLPEDDAMFDVVAYDPPYVSTGGRRTSTMDEFNGRYGLKDAPRTPALLQEMINDGLVEMHRVLKPGGILLVKCCDYVSSGRVWWGTDFTNEQAITLGFRKLDRFDMWSKSGGAQPKDRTKKCPSCKDWKTPTGCNMCKATGRVKSEQQHARRNVSTLFVYKRDRRSK